MRESRKRLPLKSRGHTWQKVTRLKLPSTLFFNPHWHAHSKSRVSYEPLSEEEHAALLNDESDADQDQESEPLVGGAASKSKWSKETTELFFKPRGTTFNKIRDQRDWVWACDIMFMNRIDRSEDDKIPIFCAIEVTTRLGFACILRTGGKRPKMEKSAASVVESLNKLVEFAGKDRVKHMAFDLGSEFNNSSVKAWCKKHTGEEPWFFDSHSKNQKGMIERFNGTIRQRLTIYAKQKDPRWGDEALVLFVKNYNESRHKGLRGATPDDAANRSKDSEQLRQLVRLFASAKSKPYEAKLKTFKPGDRVRVWVGADPAKTAKQLDDEREMGRKFAQRWTDEVYTVDKVSSHPPLPSPPLLTGEKPAGTSKAPGWYVTLEGVGSHSAEGARRFHPNDLLKVETPSASPEAEAPSAKEIKAMKAKAARDAKAAAKTARFLGLEGLDEAVKVEKDKARKDLEAQAKALEMAMARQLASQKEKGARTLPSSTPFEEAMDAVVAAKYKKVPQRASERKKVV